MGLSIGWQAFLKCDHLEHKLDFETEPYEQSDHEYNGQTKGEVMKQIRANGWKKIGRKWICPECCAFDKSH